MKRNYDKDRYEEALSSVVASLKDLADAELLDRYSGNPLLGVDGFHFEVQVSKSGNRVEIEVVSGDFTAARGWYRVCPLNFSK